MGCSSSKGASQTRRHPDGQEALHKAAKSYNKDVIMQLSDAQLDEFRDAFKQFDKDGGGSIDAQELAQLMASVGQMPSEDEVNEMVRIADADGSGSIDFPEFVTLMAHKMAELQSMELVRDSFAIFDSDGSGYIDANELQRLMINVGEPVTMEDCDALLHEVDADHDGRISFEEFSRVIVSQNSKGVIDGSTTGLASIGSDDAATQAQGQGKGSSTATTAQQRRGANDDRGARGAASHPVASAGGAKRQ